MRRAAGNAQKIQREIYKKFLSLSHSVAGHAGLGDYIQTK